MGVGIEWAVRARRGGRSEHLPSSDAGNHNPIAL